MCVDHDGIPAVRLLEVVPHESVGAAAMLRVILEGVEACPHGHIEHVHGGVVRDPHVVEEEPALLVSNSSKWLPTSTHALVEAMGRRPPCPREIGCEHKIEGACLVHGKGAWRRWSYKGRGVE
jgi:hypothetical protein